MIRRAVGVAALAAAALSTGVTAASAAPAVDVQFQSFAPGEVDALPGETVTWSNVSDRLHTVTADDGSFDSGELPGGQVFSDAFPVAGDYRYHCNVHLDMRGTVVVRPVLLDHLLPTPVPAGDRVEMTGRTSDPGAPVTIERDTGSGFQPVAIAATAADGTWRAEVTAQRTGDYRAVAPTGASATRRLLVTDRKVLLRVRGRRIDVDVTPPDPGVQVVLQLHLRERFGWFPARRARLDYASRAAFRIPRGVRARVALVDRDEWTPIATSRSVLVRRRR